MTPGKVTAFRRGRIWYLRYFEQGQQRQPRIGPERDRVRQTAAEINAQLEAGAPSSLGFEPIAIPELRDRWPRFHEHFRRSSLATISRYRTATEHLMRFITRWSRLRDRLPSSLSRLVKPGSGRGSYRTARSQPCLDFP